MTAIRSFLTVATLVALATAAPAAHADHTTYDCGVEVTAGPQPQSGPITYDGVAYGYVVSPVAGEDVSIRCYVTVNGAEVSTASVSGGGTNVAVARGTIHYAAAPEQSAGLCGEVTAGAERWTVCWDSHPVAIPPVPESAEGGPLRGRPPVLLG